MPRVLLTGFDLEEHSRLMQQIEQLNGKPVKSMFACTHLVTNKVKRTVKFLSGLSVCNHVLTSLWIVDSYKSVENGMNGGMRQKQPRAVLPEWRNEENYALVDRDQESIFNFTLEDALRSKQINGALFKNFIFCVTPQVVPSIDLLTPIISAAGGTVLRKMPTIDEIVRYSETQFHIKNQQQLIVISCYKDDQYVATLQGKPCVNLCTADFILDGVLRQTIDFMKHKINMEVNRSGNEMNSSMGNSGMSGGMNGMNNGNMNGMNGINRMNTANNMNSMNNMNTVNNRNSIHSMNNMNSMHNSHNMNNINNNMNNRNNNSEIRNPEPRKAPSSGICEDNNYIPNTPVYKHTSATTP